MTADQATLRPRADAAVHAIETIARHGPHTADALSAKHPRFSRELLVAALAELVTDGFVHQTDAGAYRLPDASRAWLTANDVFC